MFFVQDFGIYSHELHLESKKFKTFKTQQSKYCYYISIDKIIISTAVSFYFNNNLFLPTD